MSDEIQMDGVSYVSSKRAAQVSGYKQDYIGQLCRGSLIGARRVAGLWYVNLDSLYRYKQKADSYKPEPPRSTEISAKKDPEALVSLDGKEYFSASRAAEITGYHQDYVGQLAREGKVDSKQVGNRWYVERTGIVAHKAEKDALLAAVQAEAVGLSHPSSVNLKDEQVGAYFTYTKDEGDLLPSSLEKADITGVTEAQESFSMPEDEHISSSERRIPIRVLESKVRPTFTKSLHSSIDGVELPISARIKASRSNFGLITGIVATVVIFLAIGYASLKNQALYAQISSESSSAVANRASEAVARIGDILEEFLGAETVYIRE